MSSMECKEKLTAITYHEKGYRKRATTVRFGKRDGSENNLTFDYDYDSIARISIRNNFIIIEKEDVINNANVDNGRDIENDYIYVNTTDVVMIINRISLDID